MPAITIKSADALAKAISAHVLPELASAAGSEIVVRFRIVVDSKTLLITQCRVATLARRVCYEYR